jgi:hypothetical protein
MRCTHLLAGLIFFHLSSLSVMAQTCAAPDTFQPPPGGESLSGTTCSGDTTATGYCGSLPAPGPAYVIESTFGPNRTFQNISYLGGPGYDAVVYVSSVADGCGTNAACVPMDQIPDGTFFIIVTAGPSDPSGACGTFNLTVDGSFPVTLQAFSVT